MTMRKNLAVALAIAMAGGTMAPMVSAQNATAQLSGTARDEARRPFTDNSVRARDVQQGQIAATIALDAQGNFSLANLPPASYVVELVDRNGRVRCTEGPFNMTAQSGLTKDNVVIDCGNPAAWWLLGAAAAAGITAGVVAGGPASAAQ